MDSVFFHIVMESLVVLNKILCESETQQPDGNKGTCGSKRAFNDAFNLLDSLERPKSVEHTRTRLIILFLLTSFSTGKITSFSLSNGVMRKISAVFVGVTVSSSCKCLA